MDSIHRKHHAKILRTFRKIHRYVGAFLFVFFFIIAVSSILLGWKKNTNGWIQAPNLSGTSTDFTLWKPMDSLYQSASQTLRDSISQDVSITLDKIDIRPEKGMVKFIFLDHYWAVQMDGATGKPLFVEYRTSDLIENIHDGSILDKWFKTNTDMIKIIYSTLMGSALILFTVTGFWMWYGPKRMRHKH